MLVVTIIVSKLAKISRYIHFSEGATMTTYANVVIDNQVVKIEIDAQMPYGEVNASLAQISKRLENSFDDAMAVTKVVGEKVIKTVRTLQNTPSEVSVEFGLKIDAEAGAVLAKASTYG